jgi:signal peptidase I
VEAPTIKPDSFSSAGNPSLPAPRTVRARFRPWLCQLGQLVAVAALAFLCYFLISRFFLQSVQVVGMSMSPTLADSERYLLNRWIFFLRDPQPADVIVLRDPVDQGFSVKRIIAVGGDIVYLKGGQLYVNGRQLKESYLHPGTATFPYSSSKEQIFKCPPDQFFVLGDNRNNSVDSRTYGPIPRQNVLGLVIR